MKFPKCFEKDNAKRTGAKIKSPPITLPFPPQNGKYYLKSEFLQIISAYPKSIEHDEHQHTCVQVIKHLLEHKLVHCIRTTVYRLLERYEKNPNFIIHNDEWQSSGRNDAFSEEEINNMAEYIHTHWRTCDRNDINSLLVDKARKRLTARGEPPASSIPDKYNITTVRNYTTTLAAKLEVLEGARSDGRKKMGDIFSYERASWF